jgi:hypothetical protein
VIVTTIKNDIPSSLIDDFYLSRPVLLSNFDINVSPNHFWEFNRESAIRIVELHGFSEIHFGLLNLTIQSFIRVPQR